MDDRQARGGGVFCVFITMTMGFQVVTWEIADFMSFERFSIVFCPRKKKERKRILNTPTSHHITGFFANMCCMAFEGQLPSRVPGHMAPPPEALQAGVLGL